jgi:hypothetical protein
VFAAVFISAKPFPYRREGQNLSGSVDYSHLPRYRTCFGKRQFSQLKRRDLAFDDLDLALQAIENPIGQCREGSERMPVAG